MTYTPEELRWLAEWAVFLLIVLAFGIAAAYRWAKASQGQDHEQED